MSFIEVERDAAIATLRISRGKVNALSPEVVRELRDALAAIATDSSVGAVILTGRGKFFSFGFDIPELFSFSREEFTRFLIDFTSLYAGLFLCPKPVVAALNGHAIAGGCMLALACDVRLMADENGKIALNEIGFGSTVFPGATEMLRFAAGSANATEVLYSGALYSAAEAKRLGFVHEVVVEDLTVRAREVAADLGQRDARAFASIKSLLRKPVADQFAIRERASIEEFVEIWYSESTRANLRQITIRSAPAKSPRSRRTRFRSRPTRE